MVIACPLLPQINLLFALLQRLLAFWGGGAAPATDLVRVLMRAEHALAAEIRAVLAKDGVAAPDLCDVALIAWFTARQKNAAASLGRSALALKFILPVAAPPPHPKASRPDRRRPAGHPSRAEQSGAAAAVQNARAPP